MNESQKIFDRPNDNNNLFQQLSNKTDDEPEELDNEGAVIVKLLNNIQSMLIK